MATNKNSILRYKVLDQCFRNPGKRYFIDDLIAACSDRLVELSSNSVGISRRQVFEDIRFMESNDGWSIDLLRLKDGKKVYYRYQDISFSINNNPLNEVEMNYMVSTLEILDQFKGLPQFDLLHDLFSKISDNTLNSKVSSFVDFESNKYLKGIDHLGELYNAIHYKKVLKISYLPFGTEIKDEIIFHPYYLKQYNNRWFVFGFNPLNGIFSWNLALDRIASIKESNGKYIVNTEIDWEEYFEDIVGVTKPLNCQPEKINLLFYGVTGKYIETKPLHGSQKSKWLQNDILKVELELIINYEFERLLLSYCDSLKILSPSHLKDSFLTKLKKALNSSELRDNNNSLEK